MTPRAAGFPLAPPIEPMLAKLAESIPEQGAFLFEPKWDGFRAIVFRGASDLYIQTRDLKPLDRYFPEVHEALLEQLPKGCVIDGEIVIASPDGLDFGALQMRLHPAASRVAKLSKEIPPRSWPSTCWRRTDAAQWLRHNVSAALCSRLCYPKRALRSTSPR